MKWLALAFLVCVSTTAKSQTALTESSLEEINKASLPCDSTLLLLQKLGIEKAQKSTLKAQALLQVGLAHYCLGQFELALYNYQQSLDIFIVLKSKEKPAEILNLIGTLQKKQDNYELADKYFNDGLSYAHEQNDSTGIGNSLNNLGVLYFQQNKLDTSLSYYLRSTSVKSAIGDTIGLSYNYDNLGMVYTQLGVYDSAEYYFGLAAKFKRIINDEVGYAIVKNNIGEMLLEINELDKAESYFREALVVAQKVSFADFEKHVLQMISTVKEKRGEYADALAFYKQHIEVKDSLFNERKSQQVAELETKYQTEKKETEIQIQQAEINQKNILLFSAAGIISLLLFLFVQHRQRSKLKAEKIEEEHRRKAREAEINAAISSQEKERSRYARDLHDGFGQMISILNMNLNNLKDDAKPNERQQVFEASSKVIDEMYGELKNICFDLMPQTLIQNGLESALKEFTDRVNQTGKIFIELNVFGLEKRLTEIQEISLFRISQEWTNNILKYSNADRVTLQITKDQEEITLLIEDNGSGFDKAILNRGKGNGWKNLNTRANIIHGHLEIETVQGQKGNTLIVNAPVKLHVPEGNENTVETV
ncbi:ATP-binding protein [Ekhidna sp. To15]|uniref:ATP-binding protein n=1 Tax=Ekhidna sp. To15 TaxID=3395267 RepID=UPI003F52415B